MKIGVKATKNCFVRKEINFAVKVIEKLANYEALLKANRPELTAEHEDDRQRLCSEYFVLRTTLAWHEKKFDIVEHMYTNAREFKRVFDPSTAESLADVLFELGKSLLASKEFDLATKWLERALEVLADQELDKLSMDASELRISIIQSCVKGLLKIQQEPALEKAGNLVQILSHELGDRLIVLLLRLEVLAASTTAFDHVAYSEVLGRIVRTAVLNEQNFKLVMFHIRKLIVKSPDLACGSVDELFRLRILNEGREELVEKVLITRLWITVAQYPTLESLSGLEGFLDSIIENFKNPVTPAATLAAHTLLWKPIESSHAQGKYDLAEKWCRLALHRVFEKAGDLNMARVSRKLLLCAFERQDTNSAMEIFTSMPEIAKNEPMTRFLMYKVAIQSNLSKVAAESLQVIYSASSTDPTLLYACCLYSMQGNNKVQTLAALQLVLEKHDYDLPTAVHLPSLIRVTIGITSKLLETSLQNGSNNAEVEELINKLCKLFEGAVTAVQKPNRPKMGSEPIWTIHELDWFSKNSYNIAIKNISVWTPFNSLRMLKCCIAFIDQYPLDIGENFEDLALRKMFCEFSAAAALVTLARGEDNIELQLQNYLDLRKHVKSFDELYGNKSETMEDVKIEDLLQKLSILLAFDFEAACHLKAWDTLSETILNASICKSARTYQLMADCLLCIQDGSRIEIPTDVLVFNLKKIVNEAWGLENMDITSLAKYMRCLFQIAQSDNVEIAEQLLGQIADQAQEASETEQPYPTEELDWIASRAFNHAVDLYCNEQDDECREWAAKALNIAHFCNDGGALKRLLEEKLAGLNLD
ncbi:hypothetical protein HYALB_00000293 [Hymenoscyphus albidus]|uniref:Protein ZIP4 homolog n=1 Tax=Hymenoscyphus albidus TaxID=595503 RepID=A0A9N9LPW8_9HELO|nr:hypothetical protein HYALB_00000293 [Hymenoscyphus albidus]